MVTELYGGARIAYIFNNIFCKKVQVRASSRGLYAFVSFTAHDKLGEDWGGGVFNTTSKSPRDPVCSYT